MKRLLSLAALCSALLITACGGPATDNAVGEDSDALLVSNPSQLVCKAPADCKGPLPMICRVCPGGKTACAHHACTNGRCTVEICPPVAPPPPPPPACKLASDCQGVLPQFCQVCSDGTTACAHFDCQNGQCVVATCPPLAPPPPPPPPPACKLASDCQGILPQFCQVCSDGTTACAHFDCQNGQCVVATCPPLVIPPVCKADSDCKGPVPLYCRVCSDGTTACAHNACQNGQCTIADCPTP